ncbi:hypothetical protein ACHAQA_008452 [Verticillium albo-atrum]
MSSPMHGRLEEIVSMVPEEVWTMVFENLCLHCVSNDASRQMLRAVVEDHPLPYDHLDDKSTLSALCLVSKRFYIIANPILHHIIVIRFASVAAHSSMVTLTRNLYENAVLARSVRGLVLCQMSLEYFGISQRDLNRPEHPDTHRSIERKYCMWNKALVDELLLSAEVTPSLSRDHPPLFGPEMLALFLKRLTRVEEVAASTCLFIAQSISIYEGLAEYETLMNRITQSLPAFSRVKSLTLHHTGDIYEQRIIRNQYGVWLQASNPSINDFDMIESIVSSMPSLRFLTCSAQPICFSFTLPLVERLDLIAPMGWNMRFENRSAKLGKVLQYLPGLRSFGIQGWFSNTVRGETKPMMERGTLFRHHANVPSIHDSLVELELQTDSRVSVKRPTTGPGFASRPPQSSILQLPLHRFSALQVLSISSSLVFRLGTGQGVFPVGGEVPGGSNMESLPAIMTLADILPGSLVRLRISHLGPFHTHDRPWQNVLGIAHSIEGGKQRRLKVLDLEQEGGHPILLREDRVPLLKQTEGKSAVVYWDRWSGVTFSILRNAGVTMPGTWFDKCE